VTVVDRGSMAAAARALNVSPSAVAQQLHALERELGTPLIVRVGRTVRMTEQGGRILGQARELLRNAAELRNTAHDDAISGNLRLGACTTPLSGMLPDILARLIGRSPAINVHIQSATSAQLYAAVEAGELDAAFVLEAPYPIPKTCEWCMLREEALIMLAPQHLAHRDPHDLLRTEPLIRYDRHQWGGRSAEDYLRKVGITPRERFELNALNAIAVMVDRGLGVALVPDWAPPWPAGLSLARIALPTPVVGRRIGIVWSRATVHTRLVKLLLTESEAATAVATKGRNGDSAA
jgi:DNA-binding transcriptional LysR family regulator